MNEIEEILAKVKFHVSSDLGPDDFAQQVTSLINKRQQELIEKIEGSLPAEYIIENQAYKSHDDLTYESGWKDGQTKTLSEVTTILKQLKEKL